jgi:hypothetical protein
MVISIDIDKMFKLGLTPDEFVLLTLIQNKALVSAKKLITKTPSLTSSTLNNLVSKRLIHNFNQEGQTDPNRIMLRNKFIGEVKQDDFFDELLRKYPARVIRPDGTSDFLKTDLNRTRKAYISLVKKDEALHRLIMECLELEVSERTRTNKMSYFKKLPKWVASEEWNSWKDLLTNKTNIEISELGYGLKLE